MRGHIQTLTSKGYGFIRSADLDHDAFFHYSEVRDAAPAELVRGMDVEFMVERTPKGLKATDVTLL
jgi:cold shock CspA family protein